ncbi:phospholipase D-like domain-containing protein [Micromonospora sp. CPCC 205711]|uniref:phospholipase D-like domain-containing protein n=1 Tax=Micromonospora sp. CPCC 205547 TaxID=3122400 RepID=UPI002FF0CC82
MPNRRPYDPLLRDKDVQFLADADDWFPDIVAELEGSTETKMFITGWAISPAITIAPGLTLEQLIVKVLKEPNTACYILWNANMTGPAPELAGRVRDFWRRVAAKIGGEGVAAQKLKIVICVNLEYDVGYALSWLSEAGRLGSWGRPGHPASPRILEAAQTFWTNQFAARVPKGAKLSAYGNMTQFTLGSHHQKTLLLAGKKKGTPYLTGYCGMDLAGSVAGGHAVWHDAAIRLRGDLATGLLKNFTDRWDYEIDRLANTVHFGVTTADRLDQDDIYLKVGGNPLSDNVETKLTMPQAVINNQGVWTMFSAISRLYLTEIRSTYETLIDGAEQWLFIENQYFRHPDIAKRIVAQLESEDDLHVTLVLPAYSEEIGQRSDLPKLRDQYARETDPPTRAKLLAQAGRLGLTIDPFNKVSLLLQVQCLRDLVDHPRVRIWIPRRNPQTGLARPYVHSKFAVADDERLFVGSANLNGRSLDGFADSEINILLTSVPEIQRIKAARKWQNEPDDENDPRYLRWSAVDPTRTYYAANNLIRYRKAHWEIDEVYSTFPRGRTNTLDYWETFTKSASKRVGSWTPTMTRTELDAMLSRLDDVPGIDVETVDWGTTLADWTSHLL